MRLSSIKANETDRKNVHTYEKSPSRNLHLSQGAGNPVYEMNFGYQEESRLFVLSSCID